jgi:hypothetical protein
MGNVESMRQIESQNRGVYENFRAVQLDAQNYQMEKIFQQMAKMNEHNQDLVSKIMNLEKEIRNMKMKGLMENTLGNKKNRVTKQDLANARRAWGNALVKISTINDEYGLAAATKAANEVIDAAYGYNLGPVLFKPTLTTGDHVFRPTREGALAYFVGQNPRFPNDTGFALKGWRSADIQTVAEFIDGDVGLWMGMVTLTDKYGRRTRVDKSWGYKKDENGDLRIVLHHSSLPYTP